jgi:hypothetical protein
MDTRIHSGGFGMAGIITHIIKSNGYQHRQLTNKKTVFNLIQGQSSLDLLQIHSIAPHTDGSRRSPASARRDTMEHEEPHIKW